MNAILVNQFEKQLKEIQARPLTIMNERDLSYCIGKLIMNAESYQNSKHFQVWTNFDIEVFQTIRCKQGRKNKPLSNGLYVHECTRLDVKIMRDNPAFIEVKDLRELKN